MAEPAYSPGDLELFMELYRAAHEVGLDPCLIGAGAIQLGGEFGWRIRLDRNRLNAFRLGILDR